MPEREYNLKKVSETSPQFQAMEEKETEGNSYYLENDTIFGVDTIKAVNNKYGISGFKGLTMEQVEASGGIFNESKKQLLEASKRDVFAKKAYIRLMEILINGERYQEFLRDLFRKEPYLIPNIEEEVIIKLNQILERLPNTLYYLLLIDHIKELANKNSEFLRQKLPYLQEKILKKIYEAIYDGKISLSEDVIESRFPKLGYGIQDALSGELEASGGAFELYRLRITLADSLEEGEYEDTLTHELMHAFSGKTLNVEQYGENNDKVSLFKQRSGIRFFNIDGGEGRFEWLNEAITERLSLMLTGKEQSESYEFYRKVLDVICEKIDFSYFENAYFENFNPAASDPVPKWKALQTKLNEAFGPNLLLKLDKLISGVSSHEEEEDLLKKLRAGEFIK